MRYLRRTMPGHDVTAVVMVALSDALQERAAALAGQWGFPFETRSEARFQLQLSDERLALVDTREKGQGAVFVDFAAGAAAHRRRFGGGRGQSIAKAVGLKHGAMPSVLDATGGLGRDAFVLASLGCQVTLLERSPVVAALLQDGLMRAAGDEAIGAWVQQRMTLCHADALAYMRALDEKRFFDVVYLDPMFPHRRKSAQVKKEMRLLQQLLGADEDADALLPAARRVAKKRVVVKRPDYAPPLAGCEPTMAIKSKKHRYDVYVNASMHS